MSPVARCGDDKTDSHKHTGIRVLGLGRGCLYVNQQYQIGNNLSVVMIVIAVCSHS